MSEYRYKAFISYSHSDKRWANWLHRSLEMYRVPRRLRGYKGEFGAIEERIRPVFKDREELGVAHSLTDEIRSALESSEALIVICSPAAARSRWMSEEVRLFQALDRRNRIFPIIVDGDPDAAPDKGGCFPEALVVDEQGNRHEPLAADARPWGDGKVLAREKLLAGLLGIPLDLLRRREHQRRVRRRMIGLAGVVVAAAVLLFSGLSWKTAEQRRDSGQTLVAMKMNELRTLIPANENPASLPALEDWDDAEKQAAMAHLSADPGQAMARSLGLRDAGIESWIAGNLEEAMGQFREAWLLNALQYQQTPQKREIFFELGQAEFWIGQVHYDRFEYQDAERHFIAYAEITRQLIQAEPENPDWVLEMAYALTNLGVLKRDKDQDLSTHLEIIQSALEYNQIALLLDPGNRLYFAELGQSLRSLGFAQYGVCDIQGALQTANESVAHELTTQDDITADYDHQLNLALAHGQRALVRSQLGDIDGAQKDTRDSLNILQEMHQLNPEDALVNHYLQQRQLELSVLERELGNAEAAQAQVVELARQWNSNWGGDDNPGTNDRLLGARIFLQAARLSERLGKKDMARTYLDQTYDQLRVLKAARIPEVQIDASIISAAFTSWELNDGKQDARFAEYLKEPSEFGEARACDGALDQLRLAIMNNDPVRVDYFSGFLKDRNIRHPEFLRVCNAYSVCRVQ